MALPLDDDRTVQNRPSLFRCGSWCLIVRSMYLGWEVLWLWLTKYDRRGIETVCLCTHYSERLTVGTGERLVCERHWLIDFDRGLIGGGVWAIQGLNIVKVSVVVKGWALQWAQDCQSYVLYTICVWAEGSSVCSCRCPIKGCECIWASRFVS